VALFGRQREPNQFSTRVRLAVQRRCRASYRVTRLFRFGKVVHY
jgi:hypothetical protein